MATTAYVSSNGDIIRWEIPITNNGSQADTNVTVTGAYPAGVLYTTHDPVAGTTFNSATPIWTIPALASGATKTLVVYTVVTDITLAPFVWTLAIDGDNVDPTSGNNTKVLTVETTTCPPVAGAIADTNACLCGNVTINDTLCSSGTTEIRLGATTTNLDETFTINTDGSYNASGFILDPYSPATFTYSIWCIIGEDEYETSGPVTVTIPALLHSDTVFLPKKDVVVVGFDDLVDPPGVNDPTIAMDVTGGELLIQYWNGFEFGLIAPQDSYILPRQYYATLTGVDDVDPSVAVGRNTYGGTPVWARTGEGVYTCTIAGIGFALYTLPLATLGSATGGIVIKMVKTSSSVVTLSTFAADGTTPADFIGTINVAITSEV